MPTRFPIRVLIAPLCKGQTPWYIGSDDMGDYGYLAIHFAWITITVFMDFWWR